MKDLAVHLALFALISLVIVTCGAFYGEPDDAKALRTVPMRLVWFIGGCGLLVLVVLVIEHTFSRV